MELCVFFDLDYKVAFILKVILLTCILVLIVQYRKKASVLYISVFSLAYLIGELYEISYLHEVRELESGLDEYLAEQVLLMLVPGVAYIYIGYFISKSSKNGNPIWSGAEGKDIVISFVFMLMVVFISWVFSSSCLII